MNRWGLKRFAATAVFVAVAAAGWLLFAPRQLGGSVGYVTTVGSSMQPHFDAGDLVLIRAGGEYQVGDVVAYRSETVDTTVLHRIVGQEDGRLVLQGDNNSFLDPDRPIPSEVLGAEWVHIPGAGRALSWVSHPLRGALLAGGAFLAAGTATRASRHRNRTRRRGSTGAGPRIRPARSSLADAATTALVPLALAALAVISTGAVAFARPATTAGPASYAHTGRFGYHASTPANAVYPTGKVETGTPVFLRLLTAVDLTFAYHLDADAVDELAGRAALAVEVANASGWKRTVELTAPEAFDGDRFTVEGRLDLASVRRLTAEVEAATGIAGGAYTLTVIPTVEVDGVLSGRPIEDTFSPRLAFQMDAHQLRLVSGDEASDDGDHPGFDTTQAGTITVPDAQPARLAVLGRSIDITDARRLALIAAPALLVALLAAASLVHRYPPTGAPTVARKHQRNLVRVDSFGAGPDRTSVELASIDALTDLAARYDRPVLLLARDNGCSEYIVEHDSIVYRHHSGRPDLPDPGADADPAVAGGDDA
jgi:signal peptidase I